MKFESENGCIEFVDQLPIFVAAYIGEQELHQLSAFLDWSTEVFFSRKKRVAYVVDVTQLKSFSSWHRRAQADWIQSNTARIEQYTSSVSFAVATPLQRGLLTAVFWLAKPKYTINVATNRSEAVNAAVARLRQESVEVPQADVSRALVAPYAACEREQRRRAG